MSSSVVQTTTLSKISLKTFLLSCTAFFICAAYSITHPLYLSTFSYFVDAKQLPIAKLISIVLFILLLFFLPKSLYKKKLKKYLMYTLLFYALVIFLIAILFIAQPTNTTNFYKFLSWILLLIGTAQSSSTISLFWSFTHTINSSKSANKLYPILVLIGQIASVISPFFSYIFMQNYSSSLLSPLLITASLFLIIAAFTTYLIVDNTKINLLQKRPIENSDKNTNLTLKTYLFGIFGIIFFYGFISTLLEQQMILLIAKHYAHDYLKITSTLFTTTTLTQLLGGITALAAIFLFKKKTPIKILLLILPISIGIISVFLLFTQSLYIIIICIALIKSLYNGIHYPAEEILYIPITPTTRFQAKTWIDTIGKTTSKTTGNFANITMQSCKVYSSFIISSFITITIISIWCIVTLLIEKQYTKTLTNPKIIK